MLAIAHIRRGIVHPADSPVPGASKVIVWSELPASARSNGAHISMLPPRPEIKSSGRP
jgi:hypothetical protein